MNFRRGTGAGAPAAIANAPAAVAAGSPSAASVQLASFPVWWTSSSPMASPTVGIYPPGGFTNVQLDQS